MKKSSFIFAIISIIGLLILAISSCGVINPVDKKHFDEDGNLLPDSSNLDSVFLKLQPPETIKYYVEVSGSMNGFFRPNRPTDFKADVWQIMSYFSGIKSDITILTNNGNTGTQESLSSFKTKMNTGAFVSSASTQVPIMLESIMKDFNPEKGEIAILLSDMKYDPVGAAAPDVLMTQYSSDISKIIGENNNAVCLIGANSSYLDKAGIELTNK